MSRRNNKLAGILFETISPKAILVTLEKEQSLISATGSYSGSQNAYENPACCLSNEYKLAWAMGYGVPDTGGKNHKFIGFYSQVTGLPGSYDLTSSVQALLTTTIVAPQTLITHSVDSAGMTLKEFTIRDQ